MFRVFKITGDYNTSEFEEREPGPDSYHPVGASLIGLPLYSNLVHVLLLNDNATPNQLAVDFLNDHGFDTTPFNINGTCLIIFDVSAEDEANLKKIFSLFKIWFLSRKRISLEKKLENVQARINHLSAKK
jgi:hypothetical protein